MRHAFLFITRRTLACVGFNTHKMFQWANNCQLQAVILRHQGAGYRFGRVDTKTNVIADGISQIPSEHALACSFPILLVQAPSLNGCRRFLPNAAITFQYPRDYNNTHHSKWPINDQFWWTFPFWTTSHTVFTLIIVPLDSRGVIWRKTLHKR